MSSCVWMPMRARSAPHAARVMPATSSGSDPPFVSHSATMSAPAASAARSVDSACSRSSLNPSKQCSAS
jgi:hypothetical protein